MDINVNSITFPPHTKYLGVYFDSSLTIQRHSRDVYRSSSLTLQRIAAPCPFFSIQSTTTTIHSNFTSKLDYYSLSLSNNSSDQILCLQHVQNSAACLVLKRSKQDQIRLILRKLHWLPLSFRILQKKMFSKKYLIDDECSRSSAIAKSWTLALPLFSSKTTSLITFESCLTTLLFIFAFYTAMLNLYAGFFF